MSDPEAFLARWSRRKREVEKQDAAGKLPESVEEVARAQPVDIASAEPQISGKAETPAFDPASLPPIEDIGVGTDIRAFLAQNVPAEIKLAALRRVWVADPAIRDFVGLAENQWDFTKPDSIPGFGALPADFDVADMVRRVFGDPPPEQIPQGQIATTAQVNAEIPAEAKAYPRAQSEQIGLAQTEGTDCHTDGQSFVAKLPATEDDQELEMVHRTSSAATQTKMTSGHRTEPKTRRQHGGALPLASPKTNEDS